MSYSDQRVLNERDHFDKLAEETGEIWWGSTTPAGILRKRRRAELITQAVARFDRPRVLELGCGTGALTRFLLEMTPDMRLIGFDVSPKCVIEAIKRFKEYPHAEFQVGNAYQMPIHSGSMDAVVGASVIHHLDVAKSLQECLRVLKPGGVLWFSEPNMLNPQVMIEKNVHLIGAWLQNSQDETAFFRWKLAALLRETGFTDVKVQPYDFLHPIIPKPLIPIVNGIGRVVEHIPILKEISGSLTVFARKPE